MSSLMCRTQKLKVWRNTLRKYFRTTSTIAAKETKSLEDVVRRRQDEASCSIVVQVNSEKSYNELYNYCSAFGQIKGAHHYRVQQEDTLNYILVEFSSPEEAEAAISSSAYNEELTGVPVFSPFLWFKAAGKQQALKKSTAPQAHAAQTLSELNIVDGNRILSNNELHSILFSAETLEQQINLLHQRTQLNDLGIRLRFLAARQIEKAVSGMFPSANAKPFGSSVNGFGKMGCDLDLILRLDNEKLDCRNSSKRSESRLVFHTKENLTNGRSQTQRQMESIGDMLHLFLPGVCQVRRILQARVPIIKYHHEHLNLEVDLSMSNLSGFYMSELFYLFGEIDDRVRPLVFAVRRWANACGLTNPSPGRWITNFSLTCLVIFFLQQMKQPILPTINSLVKAATPEDIRVTEDGINCTFTTDLNRINFQTKNSNKICELLLHFFEFYSQFDFHNRALSLNEGRAISKPEHSALYIVNPLEQVLNVSKNVSFEECERLRIEVRNAAWVLESEVEHPSISDHDDPDATWGLLNLFRSIEKSIITPNMFYKPRLVEVSELFDPTTEGDHQGQMAATSATATNIDFKNPNVKQQVQNIKNQARSDLKQMRANTGATSVGSAKSGINAKGKRAR